MNDHRSDRRWRRVSARNTTRFRRVDHHRAGADLATSTQLPRGLR